jgi:hypothetical protein
MRKVAGKSKKPGRADTADTPYADTPIRRHADTPIRRYADTPTRWAIPDLLNSTFDRFRFPDIAFCLLRLQVRWLSGRKRRFAKALYP